MDEAAPVQRRDLEAVLRVLDRLDAEHVLHEVGERAAGPPLEAGGRRGAVDGRGHGEAGEVAVEAGELGAATGGHHRRPGGQHGVRGVARSSPRRRPTISDRSRCSCSVAGKLSRRTPAANEPVCSTHSVSRVEEVLGPPDLAGQGRRDVEHPARRHPLGAPAQIAARHAEQPAGRRARAASSSRCWRSTRERRSGSSPPVASRSWSGSSESSRTGAG